jgi:peptidoglycan hydrolase CwlO-like protein
MISKAITSVIAEDKMEESKIERYLKELKTNLAPDELEVLNDKLATELANLKFNVTELKSAPIGEDDPADPMIKELAAEMQSVGYAFDEAVEVAKLMRGAKDDKSGRDREDIPEREHIGRQAQPKDDEQG